MPRSLTAFDAQFLAVDAGNMTANYCALGVFGPDASGAPLTLERVRALVASRIDRIPALRWRLRTMPFGLDHPEFVDGPIQLHQHVVGASLGPGAGDRELADLAASMLAQRLERSRPLWRLVVVEGLADGRTGVLWLFHHAAADALAFAMIMVQLLDADPDAERTDLPEPVAAVLPRSGREVALRSLARALTHPLRAVRAGASALPYLDQVPMLRSLPGARTTSAGARQGQRLLGRGGATPEGVPHAPRTRFNRALTDGRAVAFGRVPVELVRDAKRRHGVTFNDVVVAAVGGALRTRMSDRDELPADPLLAYIPVNVRAQQADGHIGNAISSYVVAMPTHVPDARDRVLAAHGAMAAAKTRNAEAPVSLLEDANALIPSIVFAPLASGVLRLLASGWVAPPLNLLLSNVPGPPMRLHLDGAPMEWVAPLSLVFDGVTLNITVVSYADVLEIGVVGDREALDDAWELVAEIERELRELAAAS